MNGKRLRSISHPAMLYGERAGRTFTERAMGVLWRHSSVNLVDLASRRTGRGLESRLIAGDQIGGSIAGVASQPLRSVNHRADCPNIETSTVEATSRRAIDDRLNAVDGASDSSLQRGE